MGSGKHGQATEPQDGQSSSRESQDVICTCLAVDRQQQAAIGVGAWLAVEN